MRKEIRPENYIKNNFLKHQTTTSPGINYTSSVKQSAVSLQSCVQFVVKVWRKFGLNPSPGMVLNVDQKLYFINYYFCCMFLFVGTQGTWPSSQQVPVGNCWLLQMFDPTFLSWFTFTPSAPCTCRLLIHMYEFCFASTVVRIRLILDLWPQTCGNMTIIS